MGNNVDVNAFKKLLGKQVPQLPVLNLRTGEHVSLESYVEQNKVTMIIFWSTWCCGCPDSLDIVEKFASKSLYKDKVTFIAININASEIAKEEIERWTHLTQLYVNEENKIKYIRGEFGVKFLPHCSVVDKNGVVVQNGGNFYVDGASIQRELSRLLEL